MIRVRRAASLAGAVVTAGLVLGLASPAAAIEPPSRGFFGGTLKFCGSGVAGAADFGCMTPPRTYPTEQAARDAAARFGKTAKWCFLNTPVANVGVLCKPV